jgi:signal transduction histidine kinase
LHHAQKMEAVGLLTAGMAHDFNNLLTIVAGNISMLDAECEAIEPRHRRFIEVAISSCEKAGSLTRRLLNFASRKPVDPRPVDVNEVVARMADLPWRSPGERVAAEFRLEGALWPVLVDPNQLEDALLNLVLNAQDAMAGRGTLTIETINLKIEGDHMPAHPGVAAGDYVAVHVGDTGPGMPEEVRAKAFDPFFTTKEAGKGTGLGLAQVYGFAARSGGHCAIDSELGRGTTVRLYLPRYRGPINIVQPDVADKGDSYVSPKAGANAFG